MLKIDICITVIGQAVLQIFHFKVDIPRKGPKIRISLQPDFHSRFSLVASEIVPMGHGQRSEMNRTGRKICFVRS